jgi:hypothetical protein
MTVRTATIVAGATVNSMPTPEEIEAAAGIAPVDELDRKRIWAAAQAHARSQDRAPAAADLRMAEGMLMAARVAAGEHLEEGRGRAVITLSDSGKEDEVDVSVEFTPQLEEHGEGEVGGTPAQMLALEILQDAFGDGETAELN